MVPLTLVTPSMPVLLSTPPVKEHEKIVLFASGEALQEIAEGVPLMGWVSSYEAPPASEHLRGPSG